MIHPQTHLLVATAVIFLHGSLDALAQTNLTASIQDANFGDSGFFTPPKGFLDLFQSTAGRITDGAIGRNGRGLFDWTGWAIRFVDDGVSRSTSPSALIDAGILTFKGLSTVGATKGFNVSAYQTLTGQSYQRGIYTLTTSVRALPLSNATAIQSTGIGLGFLSGSSTTTAMPSIPILVKNWQPGGILKNNVYGTEADNSGAGANSTLDVTLLPAEQRRSPFS